MNARTIATVFVCLAVVFAGCAGMNDGTGGDSADDGAAGDTTTASSDATTTSSDGGTTTQSTATTATVADEATTAVGSPTAAGTTTMAPETTAAPTATSTATAQPTATTTAAPATSDGGATTTDTPTESGGGDSASVSNPYTEGEYYRITGGITTSSEFTTKSALEFRVLSVNGEQVTVKLTNLETGESKTIQDDWKQVFTTFYNKGFVKIGWFATLFSFAHAVQEHSMTVGSKWTRKSMTFTVTGTDTVAGVSCKTVKIVSENAKGTVCVNKDVTFALRFALHSGGATTFTVEEYHSGEDG